MSAWSLLFVPASLGMITLFVVAISWIEQHMLSPRLTAKHTSPSPKPQPEPAGEPQYRAAAATGP